MEAPPRERHAGEIVSGVQLITVAEGVGDLRLDRWFKRHYPQLAHGRLQKLLRTGQIRVDGKRAESSTRLSPGQTIRVPPLGATEPVPAHKKSPAPLRERDAEDLRARVLFRDDWAIVIDKPPGLAVQGGSGTTRHLDAMLDALAFDGERPRLVHRLDRDTSGVLVLARTALAAKRLAENFRGKSARKYYWAVTAGVPEEPQGRIDAALAERADARGQRVAPDDDEGRQAGTLYSVVD